jgi:hypothetical protein
MKKSRIILAFLILVIISCPVLAQELKFNDVPDDHWAKPAVYDLVKKGITQGYPDGTFRGSRNITRYETAMFLSKLAALVDTSSSVDVSSLKSEIASLKQEIEDLKKAPSRDPKGLPVTGSFKARYRIANMVTSGVSEDATPANKGPRIDYRLKMTLSKDFGEGAGVKVNLDTMDTGWNGGLDEDLAKKLLDVEGNLLLHAGDLPINIKMTAGPGPVVYSPTMDATLPSEVGTVYMRPRNSITAQALAGAFDASLGYTARTISTTGEVDVSQLSATLGYNIVGLPLFEIFKIQLAGDYLATDVMRDAKPTDSRGKVTLSGSFNDNATTSVALGASKSINANEGYFIEWTLSLADAFQTGTYATIRYTKAGSEYLVTDLATAEFDMVGLDMFDRALVNNVQDWGFDITQFITETLALKAKGDVRLTKNGEYGKDFPETSTLVEGGLSYNIAPNTVLDLLYKTYNVPSNPTDSTTDVATLAFLYKF